MGIWESSSEGCQLPDNTLVFKVWNYYLYGPIFQTSQKGVALAEPLYQKVHKLGQWLMHGCDSAAKQQIQELLASNERQWRGIASTLKDRHDNVESVLKLWSATEGTMEELLAWLKDTRLLLASHLPDSYDDLQVELQKCEVRRGRVSLFGWLLWEEMMLYFKTKE